MKRLIKACIGIVAAAAIQGVSAHFPQQPTHQMADLGTMRLEKGGSIDKLRMSYVTHGQLNAAQDNAIVVVHGLGSNHHAFDHLIGPGKGLDTDQYFVIAVDVFGATQTGYDHSTSPTNSGLKMKFPLYNLRDMNQAMHKLVTEKLGIRRLLMIAGISSGGFEAMQYAVTYPEHVEAIVPIVGGAHFTSQTMYLSIRNSIIENCQGWEKGDYDVNPKICASNALFTLAPFFYTRDWWQQNIDSPEAFDRWRRNWGEAYFDVQDTRDLYYRNLSFGQGWLGDTPGYKDLNAVLAAIKAKTLFIYNPQDAFSTPEHWASQLKAVAGSRAVAIDSPAGHLICCNGDPNATKAIERALKGFLSELGAVRKAQK